MRGVWAAFQSGGGAALFCVEVDVCPRCSVLDAQSEPFLRMAQLELDPDSWFQRKQAG